MPDNEGEAGVEAPDDRQALAKAAKYATVRMALRAGFNVPESTKIEALTQIQQVLTTSTSPRARLAAIKLLLALERHNIDTIATAIKADQWRRIYGEPGEQEHDLTIKFS